MAVRVVDASALGAVVFGEPQAEEIAGLLKGALLIGPTLLPFEMASICLKKIKAHPSKRALILKAYNASEMLDLEYLEVEYQEVIALAEQTGLTTYDSAYLWLARQTGGLLVTLDAKLRLAAKGKIK
jgi:predicted nucleic acid-binding protein